MGEGLLFTELPSLRKRELGLRPLVKLFSKLFFFVAGQDPWDQNIGGTKEGCRSEHVSFNEIKRR